MTTRSLDAYRIGANCEPHPTRPGWRSRTGLRRLKLAAMRRLAAELLITAKTQRWTPEEFLRTLIEAEITARTPPTPTRAVAGFPVTETVDVFQVAASSIPAATFADVPLRIHGVAAQWAAGPPRADHLEGALCERAGHADRDLHQQRLGRLDLDGLGAERVGVDVMSVRRFASRGRGA